ncbi:MAG: hypothetical protein M1833_003897 [Piccolia ochrophora]|nr:MAG: hypothetical protein M1833_003897 [Piccolia ochrophora]
MDRMMLLVNPNSTESMTNALIPLVEAVSGQEDFEWHYITSPAGPASINNDLDAAESMDYCLPSIEAGWGTWGGVLVACYSEHPLVARLRDTPRQVPVIGIFEASVSSALLQLRPHEMFGIVSTGKAWEALLTTAVGNFLGTSTTPHFAGVATTGLSATELHDTPPEEVRARMKQATKELLRKGNVGAICLGCAGMAGMDEMVREACVEELGGKGELVRVIDGVKAGVVMLEGMMRAETMKSR